MNSNHYLAEEKIGTLMLKFSIPCIMSLLVSSLYNIVDQIFVGRGVGYLGNGATNVVFPITIIALALSLLIGDACAAFLSLSLGKGDAESAHKSVGSAIMLSIGVGIVLVVLFLFGQESILHVFGATENNIEYAREYFFIIALGIPFFVFTNAMNSIIRADGSPAFAMVSTLMGCLINLIFDPITIFVLHWGMRGAAIATIAGQIVTALLAVGYMFHTKSFKLNKSSFIPHAKLVRSYLPLGISSFLTQISIVVIMGVMNNTLVHYGAQSEYGPDIPMTVVGIVMKVFQIVIALVIGIAAGSQPIVGYNYGAGHTHRVKEIYSTMLKAELVVGMVSMAVFELFPRQIIGIFGSESALYNQFAVLAFRIYLGTIVLCCVQKSTSVFLQALGCPVMSLSLSLLRDFIISVPAILLLARFGGVETVLWSAPIADILSIIVAALMMRHVWSHRLKEAKPAEESLAPMSFAKMQQI